jgi:hypothetical protein
VTTTLPADTANVLWTQPEDSEIFARTASQSICVS